MVNAFGKVVVECRTFDIFLFYLVLFYVISSRGHGIVITDDYFICYHAGNFSVTNDCRTFVRCLPNSGGHYATSQCTGGYSFDASERTCLPSQHVDCSIHYVSYPLMSESSIRLKKREILVQKTVLGRRRKRELVKTKPWGIWKDGVYIPYLVLWSQQNNACSEPPSEVTSIVYHTTPSGAELLTTTSESEYQDEVITDTEIMEPNVINYGHKIGTDQRKDIVMKKVQFLSEDLIAGGEKEMKVAQFVLGADANVIWTHKPNAEFTLSRLEEIEDRTDAPGPWGFTRIFTIANQDST